MIYLRHRSRSRCAAGRLSGASGRHHPTFGIGGSPWVYWHRRTDTARAGVLPCDRWPGGCALHPGSDQSRRHPGHDRHDHLRARMDRQNPPAGGLHQPAQNLANDRIWPNRATLGLRGRPPDQPRDRRRPQDPHNLFPQPRTGPRSASVKDQEETQLQRDVCAGRTTLAAAQAQILADWTHS